MAQETVEKYQVQEETSVGQTGPAESRYRQLEQYRQPFLDRARECSELTLPYLIPPDGWTGHDKLYTPFQSLGSRGVNNLASKLLMTLLPVNTMIARMEMSEKVIEQAMRFDKKARMKVEEGLSTMERKLVKKINTGKIRPPFFEAMKHLIVAGNVLIHRPMEKNAREGLRVFPLSRYVVCRDPMGNLLEIIVKEDVSPKALPDKLYAAVKNVTGYRGDDKTCSIFTHIKREEGKWEYYQEIHGLRVPGSGGTYPLDRNPWIVLRWHSIDGEDYGRGHCEDYLGALQSLEGLSRSLVQGCAAAAKVLFLTDPNGVTKKKDLANSQTGDFVTGRREDVDVLQLEKYNDFRVNQEEVANLKRELSYAFLLNSAIQRDAERVTAEEWRQMVQELEDSLGGIYSLQSQEVILPLVTVLLWEMEKAGEIPVLPKGTVKPTVITGLEALGRGHDLMRLKEFGATLQQTIGPEMAAQIIDPTGLAERIATSLSIDTNGLLKTPEQQQQEAEQAQQQALIQKLGPNVVNQLGGLVKEGKLPGMEQAAPAAAASQANS